jgi:hypothetical protein
MKAKRQRPEATLQRQVAAWLDAALGEGVMWRMIENQPRNAIAGANQKRRGIKAGTPDILIWEASPRMTVRAYAIELKSKKGRQSPEQAVFETEFELVNGQYAICRSLDDVEAAIDEWRIPIRVRR